MNTKLDLRFFNTTGPCDPDYHYMLPPEDRLVGAQLHRYIKHRLYWVLHAPRQMGKTTFLQSWMREINAGDEAVACYVSVESCRNVPEPERSMPAICAAIRSYAAQFNVPIPELPQSSPPLYMLNDILHNWAKLVEPKPLIVLFDEVDVLIDGTVLSFLSQLRDGFASRGVGTFPISVVLVGMRDLRDYITASKGGIPPNPGSPFNIKEDSAQLSNFSRDDVTHLFAQRTAENGQQITSEALDYVFEQSSGQPWIVNSLFKRATMRILDDTSTETVTRAHIVKACEQMIEARETHLDALSERLREPRIRRVIEPVITGEINPDMGRSNPDVMLAMDLGLVKWTSQTGLKIANPVYAEILTLHLHSGYHDILPPPSSWSWQKPDGGMDMDKLLKEFQKFWRRHADLWEERAEYTEAFPHLLLMAFLQRVINGGGTIDREYAAGRGRTDLTVRYKDESFIIEIKLIRYYDTPELVKEEGLEQIRRYRDRIDPQAPAYLVIFDRRPETKSKTWDERVSWDSDGGVTVLGC